MNRWVWSYLYWGFVWMFCGFLIPELIGEYVRRPWVTLSETVWHAERYPFVASGVFALLIGLIAHFLYSRPLWASLLFGVLVALAAHVADHRWP